MAALPVAEVAQGEFLGRFALGASLQSTLTYIKSQPKIFPQIDLIFSQQHPLHAPIAIKLRQNGLQLRFDGREQRLRMIEVLDFSRMKFTYKSHDIVRLGDSGSDQVETKLSANPIGPVFKNVYKLFGPTTPGEYTPPLVDQTDQSKGLYCLSYPGISFNFHISTSAWSSSLSWSAVVSLLSSSATMPASSMCIFHGESWPKARSTIFTAPLQQVSFSPRFMGRGEDIAAAGRDIEYVRIHGQGRLELVRRGNNVPSTWLVTGETTPQDLVTDLGPPDSIYKKPVGKTTGMSTDKKTRRGSRNRRESNHSDSFRPSSFGTSNGSATDATSSDFDTDEEDPTDEAVLEGNGESLKGDKNQEQVWYNYYHHGMDILIGTASCISTPSPTAPTPQRPNPPPPTARNHPTVIKVLLHANIPSTHAFNRHRRLRWTINHCPLPPTTSPITSEQPFRDISSRLKSVFASTYKDAEEARSLQLPMAIDRGWGGALDEGDGLLLGGSLVEIERRGGGQEGGTAFKASASAGLGSSGGFGSTELYGFPGMVFEVMRSGWVVGVLVY